MNTKIDPHTIKVGDIVATCYGRVCSYCIVLTPLDEQGNATVHICTETGDDLPYKVNDKQWNFFHNDGVSDKNTTIRVAGNKKLEEN